MNTQIVSPYCALGGVATQLPAPGIAGVKDKQHASVLQMVLCETMPDEVLVHSSFSPSAGLIDNPFAKKTLLSIKATASERKKGDSLTRPS